MDVHLAGRNRQTKKKFLGWDVSDASSTCTLSRIDTAIGSSSGTAGQQARALVGGLWRALVLAQCPCPMSEPGIGSGSGVGKCWSKLSYLSPTVSE